ncbi:head GIN domain-containing protein [Rasiella sp. SM2506]|uniref:head GIN domain-containing protein n=1 Tax=Rasiella sp. SM2506 TaxID=3423914 RepID=UPI003D7A2431
MKNTSKLSIVIALALLGSLGVQAQRGNKQVKGSGTITTTKVTTADYDEIAVIGSLTAELVSGKEGDLRIKADDNLHELVEIESTNGKLTIKMKNGVSYSSKHDIIITVPFEDISTISLTGSGDIIGKSKVTGNALTISVTGSGDVALDTEATGIDAKVTGSGDMKLSGKVENLEVKVSGSGDFEGYSLDATNVEVYVSGSGGAQVAANATMKARVNGSGDIRYKGNPATSDKKVMGSGSVKAQ